MSPIYPNFVTPVNVVRASLYDRLPFSDRAKTCLLNLPSVSHKRRRVLQFRACTDSSSTNTRRTSVTASSPGPSPLSDSDSQAKPGDRNSVDLREAKPRTQQSLADANGADPLRDIPPSDSEASKPNTVRLSLGALSGSIPARWLLYAVPFMWGSFGPAVRLLFSQDVHPDPSLFNTERLLLSTLVYVPILAAEYTAYRTRDPQNPSTDKPLAFLTAGAELGVYVFLANVAQVLGLQQTSASRAAFLVQLQTVIVPVLAGIFGLDKISPKTWLSSLVAVAGVALLSSDKGHGSVSSLTGDALEVLSAFFFSTYIIRLSRYCNEVPANPLVAVKIAVQAVLSVLWAASSEIGQFFKHVPTEVSTGDEIAHWTLTAVLVNLGVVLWTGLLSSAASGWAQTKGQQGVPASQAVVIFSTQPLWASALAAVVLGESFGPKGFAGGAMIVAATLIAGNSDEREAENCEENS